MPIPKVQVIKNSAPMPEFSRTFMQTLRNESNDTEKHEKSIKTQYHLNSLEQWFSTLFLYSSLTNTNTVSSSPTKITNKQLLNYLNSKTYFWDKTKTLQKNIFTIG